jgi:ketosteroid isomerase-like protein
MSTRDLVLSYYKSLSQKDDAWQGLYSEDAAFCDASHTLDAKGKIVVIQSFVPFLKGVAEVWEVRDGKLAKLTIYFDLTAYRSFMKA